MTFGCFITNAIFKNHAEGVSHETVQYFGSQCKLAAQSLRQRHPLPVIFGTHFAPPIHNKLLYERLNSPSAVRRREIREICDVSRIGFVPTIVSNNDAL